MGCVETMDKKTLHKYIAAFVMGDGGVYFSGKNCRYVRNQLACHRDYLEFQASILEELTSVSLFTVKEREGRKPTLCLMSKTHPVYTQMRNHFYTDNYKGVSEHYLKLLDWEMMAYLFCDDGSNSMYTKDGHDYLDIRLNTKRLSYGDSWLLKKAIREKLGVEFNVVRHYHRYFLRLRSKDDATFLNSVRPYMPESFNYKLTCPHDWPLLNEGGDIVRPNRRRLETAGNEPS